MIKSKNEPVVFPMLNIEENRRARKYTSGEMTSRLLWAIAQPLFRFSPRPCFGWRRFLLRCFGAKIGRRVHVYPSATIYFPWNLEAGDESAIGEHAFIYNLGRVTLGPRVTISHCAHLCAGTHDHTRSDFPLLRPPIMPGSAAIDWNTVDIKVDSTSGKPLATRHNRHQTPQSRLLIKPSCCFLLRAAVEIVL